MKIFKRSLSIILDILFILFVLLIIKIGIVPNVYVFIISLVLGIIAFVNTFLCFKTKGKTISIILIVLNILTIGVSIYSLNSLNTTGKFFSNISDVKEKSTYYVVVKKDSSYQSLSDLKGKNIGVLKAKSDSYSKAIEKVSNKTEIKEKNYDVINNLVEDLYSDKTDSILINSNTYNILEELYEDFSSKTRIIDKIYVDIVKTKIAEDKSYNEPFSVFISGIDTYGDISNVSRSDVNIVATINPKNNEVILTSIPRDYYVQLHGTAGEKDKLTHAGIYGINMSMDTVGDLLETDIDYYLRVNFDTVIKVVDAVEGIEVYSDETFTAYDGTVFKKGLNKLNGKKALAYSRERHSFNEGDRKRGVHQQQVIEAIVKKITSSTVLLSNYSEILNSLKDSFQTDMSNDMLKYYIKAELNETKKWEIASISLNGTDAAEYTYSMPGIKLYVMKPDETTVNKSRIAIKSLLSGGSIKNLNIKKN